MEASNLNSSLSKFNKSSIKPLNLNEISKLVEPADENNNETCLLCEELFDVVKSQQDYLSHLFSKHRLVISDVAQIGEFRKY